VPELTVDTRIERGVAVMTPRGELDLAGAPELEKALATLDDEPDVHAIVLDLSAVEFMDSSGLRAVVQADRRTTETGRRFALVKGGEPVHRVFEITRMTERLTWVSGPADLLDGAEERA